VRTPGGLHWYFTDPGVRLRGRLDPVGLIGHDVKQRGYVLAPPSLHPSGERYVLLTDDPPAPLPDWLVGLARAPEPVVVTTGTHDRPLDARERAYVDAAVRGEIDALTDAAPGSRNSTLARAAFVLGRLIGGGALDTERAVALLETACVANGLAVDEPRQTRATLHGQLARGRRQPRRVPSKVDDATRDALVLLASITDSDDACETVITIVNDPNALRSLALADVKLIKREWELADAAVERCGGVRVASAFIQRVLHERQKLVR
jgi:hypothetical protein